MHLAFVLGLIFLVFAASKKSHDSRRAIGWLRPGGVPLVDWLLGPGRARPSVLYIPYIFDDLAFRVGNPLLIDVVMGYDPVRHPARGDAALAWAGRCR